MNSSLGSVSGPDGLPLIAVAAWPTARTAYRLGGTDTHPELMVVVSLPPEAVLPGPDDAPAADPAAEHAQRYRTIGAQLDEPGLGVSLSTSLDPSRPLPVAEGVVALRRFARSAELFAQAATAATAAGLTGLATLDELLDRYGLTADRLAAANVDRPLNGLLAAGQPLAMPTGQIEPDTVPAGVTTLGQVAAALGVAPGQLLADNRGLRLATEPAMALPGIVALPPATRIPYPVRAGDTLAALAQRFATTAYELVADNAEVGGTLLPGIRIELDAETGAASTDTLAGDSFASVRARLAGDAELSLDAVAAALDRLGPVLEAGPVLSCPLAVLDGDGPLTATEAAAGHGCPPVPFAAANAALLGLLQPGVRLGSGDRTTTTAEQDTLHAVLARLNPDTDLPWTEQLDRLLVDSAAVPLFRAGARALLPPVPVILLAAPGDAPQPAGPAVPLTVTLRLARGDAERADTRVPPGPSWDDLVEACLAALPGVRLATDPGATAWAVPFGSPGIASVRIGPVAGGTRLPAFGLPPLYSALLDFSAPVSPVTERGELGPPVRQQFSAADTEPWARLFVTDLDRCLDGPLRERLPDPARATLAGLRRQLVDILAGSLVPVAPDTADDPAVLASARAALASLGRAGLAAAYRADVLARYPATVTAPYGGGGQPTARLVGSLRASGRPDLELPGSRIELAPSGAGCTFALSCTDPWSAARVSLSPSQVIDGIELDLPGSGPVLLRFARPLAGGYRPEAEAELPADELPPAELPVPLREHPEPLAAQPMAAAATFAGPGRPTLAEAMRWTASLGYLHQHAAQDVVRLSIGRQSGVSAVAAPLDLELAEALARYVSAAAELIGLVASDDPPPEGIDAASRREQAAGTLAGLAAAVVKAWRSHPVGCMPAETGAPAGVSATETGALAGGSPGETPDETQLTGDYQLRAVYASGSDGRHLLDRLVVSRTGAAGRWPEIAVNAGDRQLMLTPGPVAGDTRDYTATDASVAAGALAVRLEWPGLLGAPAPGTAVTASVRRNPDAAPEFVLTSAPVRVGVVSPSLRWSESLPLPGDDLAQALQRAFTEVGGGRPGCRVSLEVGYSEPVGDSYPVLPVLLVPGLGVGPNSGREIATALQAWQQDVQPATAGAYWQLRLGVLSPRADEPPLVTFEQLVFPASTVSPKD